MKRSFKEAMLGLRLLFSPQATEDVYVKYYGKSIEEAAKEAKSKANKPGKNAPGA